MATSIATYEDLEELVGGLMAPLDVDLGWARDGIRSAEERGVADSVVQTWRRTFVRAALAAIEAEVWLLKQYVLARLDGLGGPAPEAVAHFTPAEIAGLREETYGVSDKGAPYARSAKTSFMASYLFTARAMAKLAGATEASGTPSAEDQAALRIAKDVRDRLMHPKREEAMLVSAEEIEAIERARTGFDRIEAAIAQSGGRLL